VQEGDMAPALRQSPLQQNTQDMGLQLRHESKSANMDEVVTETDITPIPHS
jgi:hypothetical protein